VRRDYVDAALKVALFYEVEFLLAQKYLDANPGANTCANARGHNCHAATREFLPHIERHGCYTAV
jgi:hypothetical protein